MSDTPRTEKICADGYEEDVREKRDDFSHYMAATARMTGWSRTLERECAALTARLEEAEKEARRARKELDECLRNR